MQNTSCRSHLYLLPVIVFGAVFLAVMLLQHSEARGQAVDLATAIETVAKKTIPAVVHIEVTERQEVANPLLPF